MVGNEPVTLRIKKGLVITFGGRVGSLALGLGSNAILARLLPNEDLGLYFLALSLMTLASTISNMGLGPIMVREVASALATHERSKAKEFLVSSLVRILASSVLIFFFVANGHFVISFFSPMLVPYLSGIAFWGLLLTLQNYVSDALRGIHQIGLATIAGGLWSSFWLFVALSFVLYFGLRTDLNHFFQIVSLALTSSIFIFGLKLHGKVTSWEEKREPAEFKYFHHSFPVWIISLQALILSQADLWVLAMVVGERDVAIYGSALRVSLLAGMPLGILTTLLPTFIAELYASNRIADLEVLVRKLSLVASVPVALFLVGSWFWGAGILNLIFGPGFSLGDRVLVLLVLGHFVGVLCGPSGTVLTMTGHQKSLMQVTVLSSISTLLAVFWGGVFFGMLGVAAGVLLGQILHNVAMLFVVKSRLGIWTHILTRPKIFNGDEGPGQDQRASMK